MPGADTRGDDETLDDRIDDLERYGQSDHENRSDEDGDDVVVAEAEEDEDPQAARTDVVREGRGRDDLKRRGAQPADDEEAPAASRPV
ncbi:hypothetical protein [Frondihabitans sucicola]|uniref:hypothetical protein n=1 Tax=Frondihabitans sucicola TaxID=1268041 RepID=UPI0025731AA9|nr:hypothetical protein [Frondihabitans sucicola]